MAYCFFLHAVRYTLYDILDDTSMVTVWFIVPESHHSPARNCRVPVNFHDAIVDLFARGFQPIYTLSAQE